MTVTPTRAMIEAAAESVEATGAWIDHLPLNETQDHINACDHAADVLRALATPTKPETMVVTPEIHAALRSALLDSVEVVKMLPKPEMEIGERARECDWPKGARFSFHDEPGAHDPCYVVMPDGAMLALNHHAGDGVDIARAHFIINACNDALGQVVTLSPAAQRLKAVAVGGDLTDVYGTEWCADAPGTALRKDIAETLAALQSSSPPVEVGIFLGQLRGHAMGLKEMARYPARDRSDLTNGDSVSYGELIDQAATLIESLSTGGKKS